MIIGTTPGTSPTCSPATPPRSSPGPASRRCCCRCRLPTPVVAFGIRHFGCVAGVVVTASHNPPQDNGYKVYLGDGSQIVPPADAEIAARIDAGQPGTTWPTCPAATHYTRLGDELVEAYLAPGHLAGAAPDAPRASTGSTPRCTGSAARSWPRPWQRAGFLRAEVVRRAGRARPGLPDRAASPTRRSRARSTWRWPWPSGPAPTWWWPTTPTPTGARSRHRSTATWRMLHGDELGALLGDDALRRGVEGTYACSIVSSSLLAAMAAAHGQPFATTLTGFKWIGRVPGLGLRLRGGDRLLRRSPGRARQGRHLGPDPGADPGRRAQGGGPDRRGPAGRDRHRVRGVRDRPAVGPGRRPDPDRRGHDPTAGAAAEPRCSGSRCR